MINDTDKEVAAKGYAEANYVNSNNKNISRNSFKGGIEYSENNHIIELKEFGDEVRDKIQQQGIEISITDLLDKFIKERTS
jgi:hypothetical protein